MLAQTPQNLLLGVIFAVATSLVMSIAAVLIKYSSATLSIESIVFIQYLVCLLVMLPWLAHKGVGVLKTDHLKLHLLRGLSGWACFYFYYLALSQIPLADAAMLRNAAPLWVPVLLYLWKGESLALKRWLPVFAGLFGVALVIQPNGDNVSIWHLAGIGSALMLAGSMVTTRYLTVSEPNNRILFYYFLISTLASIPLALLHWKPIPNDLWPILLLIGLSIWLVMWLYTQAYRYANATVISPLNYLGVIFTGLMGWLFWDQLPTTWAVAGAVLIIGGGVAAVWMGRKSDH